MREIKLTYLDQLGDPKDGWGYVSAIFTEGNIYYTGTIDRGFPKDYIPHRTIQDRIGIDPENIIGGAVLRLFPNQPIRNDGDSHTFPSIVSKEEYDEYLHALIEELSS